ncbi:PAS-domain containing protein [Cognatishimia sp. F0-27]|nr:PAS-domain containing protein [Cognatishimia sp. F0-27]
MPLRLWAGQDAQAALNFRPGGDGVVHISIDAPELSHSLKTRMQWDEARNSRLISATEEAPFAMWETAADGSLSWCNGAYRALIADTEAAHGAGETADAAPQGEAAVFTLAPPPDTGARAERVHRIDAKGRDHWYEVTSLARAGGAIHFATNIDSLVDAEMAQRKFVQTLTKTFAHLPIGLAVFDRDRRLVLFNPALVDLTNLRADFLTARPNLMSFFDHMRENQTMPEPKNYGNWREQLSEVISAAHDDRYCETWNLASGLTYKITGRPHPDGAVAFLLEDISAEISLTRRFRSELELTQSVIDCFPDSVAVFSQLGVLAFSNAAYRDFWKCDPDSAFAEMTIVDATRDWQSRCDPSPIWSEIREFVLTLLDRAAWDAHLRTRDGLDLTVSVIPVSAGATMVRFSETVTQAAQTQDESLVTV